MALRYLGGFETAVYNPLASNITSGTTVVQTQGVFTLQQQAQAQATQQWVTDPNFKNTTLLLQADNAANGAQNNTFLDSSANSFAITRNGNTTQGSFTPFSQAAGYWGNYFNGSSYLSIANSTSFYLDSDNVTIEAWIYPTLSDATGRGIIVHADTAGSWTGWQLQYKSSKIVLETNSGASTGLRLTGTATISVNTWYHIALVKNSTTFNVYVNGVLDSTGTSSLATNIVSELRIAAERSATPSDFYGNISNVRITKGQALTAGNFTPPTAPVTTTSVGWTGANVATSLTGTVSLLTCQSNRFIDISSNAFAITINGTPSVQAFSPFAPALQWTPTVVGGSGYFDGTGDYLQAAANAAFDITQVDGTIEAWVYRTVAGVVQSICNYRGGSTGWEFRIAATTNVLFFYFTSGSTITGTTAIPANTWTHVAFSRSGTTGRLFVNGVLDATNSSFANGTAAAAAVLRIGADDSATPASLFTGYLANERLVKGAAVYTGAFTPPTLPLSTSGSASASAYPSTTNVNTTFAASTCSLLLNYTNAGIYDGKMGNLFETVSTAQVATSPVKYGSGSMKFNGTSDYLFNAAPNVVIDNNFSSGNYTIEFWINPNATPTTETGILCVGPTTSGAANRGWGIEIHNGTSTGIWFYQAGVITTWTSLGAFPLLNTWSHIAIVRNSTVVTCYINGVATGTASAGTNTQTAFSAGDPLFVGCFYSSATAGRFFYNGYMDDLRITKGVARYTANFLPPQVALPRQ